MIQASGVIRKHSSPNITFEDSEKLFRNLSSWENPEKIEEKEINGGITFAQMTTLSIAIWPNSNDT